MVATIEGYDGSHIVNITMDKSIRFMVCGSVEERIVYAFWSSWTKVMGVRLLILFALRYPALDQIAFYGKE